MLFINLFPQIQRHAVQPQEQAKVPEDPLKPFFLPRDFLNKLEKAINIIAQKILNEVDKHHSVTEFLKELQYLVHQIHTVSSYKTLSSTIGTAQTLLDTIKTLDKTLTPIQRKRKIEKILIKTLPILQSQYSTCKSQLHPSNEYIFVSRSDLGGPENFVLQNCYLLLTKGDLHFIPKGFSESLSPENVCEALPDQPDKNYPCNAKDLQDYKERFCLYSGDKENIAVQPTLDALTSPIVPSDAIIEVNGTKVIVPEAILTDILRLDSLEIDKKTIYNKKSLAYEYASLEERVERNCKEDLDKQKELARLEVQMEFISLIYRELYKLTNDLSFVEKILLLSTQSVQTRLLMQITRKFAHHNLKIGVQSGSIQVEISVKKVNHQLCIEITHTTFYTLVKLSNEEDEKKHAESINQKDDFEKLGTVSGVRSVLIRVKDGFISNIEDTTMVVKPELKKPKKSKKNQQISAIPEE